MNEQLCEPVPTQLSVSSTTKPSTRPTLARPRPKGEGGGLTAGTRLNVAVTDCAALIDTEHVAAVPEQPPPDQPANTEPEAGDSLNTTDVPCTNDAEHVLPQSTPAGLLVTVPDPEPGKLTDNGYDGVPDPAVKPRMLPEPEPSLFEALSSKQYAVPAVRPVSDAETVCAVVPVLSDVLVVVFAGVPLLP